MLSGFKKYANQVTPEIKDKQFISIVIPFRNEAKCLPELEKSLKNLNYPRDKFEVILVNDHSDDESAEILKTGSFIQVVESKGQGKKAAQLEGVKSAKYDLIACTDADCVLPENWLDEINAVFQLEQTAIAFGPVKFQTGNPRRKLEFMALIGSTFGMLRAGLHVMGNGANMAFKKDIYLNAIGGMRGEKVPTGDDVFLLHEISQRGLEIGTISSFGIVKTNAPETTQAFINQRLRWASKAKYYRSVSTIAIGALVFGINLLILIQIAFAVFAPSILPSLLTLLLGKMLIDFVLLKRFSKGFDEPFRLSDFLVQQVINLVLRARNCFAVPI